MSENTYSKGTLLKGGIAGILLFIVSSIILLLLSSFALSFHSDPKSLTMPLALATLYISAFAGGFLSTTKGESILSSIISGTFVWLVFVIASVFAGSSDAFSTVGKVIASAALPLAFFIGGGIRLIINNKRPRRRNGVRKRR